MAHDPAEEFISERLLPVPGSADAAGMARGEPGLPARFTWRDEEYTVVEVLRKWKTSGRCKHGPSKGPTEMYLRRHWFEIRTVPELIMTVYCQRQASSTKQRMARWFVYSVRRPSQAS